MITSKAWEDLTPKQKELYIVCKDRYYCEKKHPEDTQTKFYLNRALWANEYHLYSPTDGKGFQRDIQALIEHGFIKCVKSGETTRTRSIYQYSDKWQKWGTPEFKIEWNEMNAGLARRTRKAKEQSHTSQD